jgi:hypothetical protein
MRGVSDSLPVAVSNSYNACSGPSPDSSHLTHLDVIYPWPQALPARVVLPENLDPTSSSAALQFAAPLVTLLTNQPAWKLCQCSSRRVDSSARNQHQAPNESSTSQKQTSDPFREIHISGTACDAYVWLCPVLMTAQRPNVDWSTLHI